MKTGRSVVTMAMVALLSVPLAAALSGCSVLAGAVATTPGAAASTPGPTTTSAPAPTPTSDKFAINCNLVLSDAHAAALAPLLTPVAGYAPATGTLGTTLVDHGGQPCGWRAGSTASLEVVVAIPFASDLKAAKAATAASGQPADPDLSEAAYFEVADGMGRAQLFMGSYWIEVASPAFTTAEQAESVYALVIHDLRSAGG